ncbi:MAG TPA: O-antigen ligase family protein [Candidatus Polarisedimenticolia bacterium]|jgi:O-antigen ligase|nr:O-antigen ligase family protein [Candidatus Polarisedimenticolia bacterium]
MVLLHPSRRRQVLSLSAQLGLILLAAYAHLRSPIVTTGLVLLGLLSLAFIESPRVLALGFLACLPVLQTFGTQLSVYGEGSDLLLNVMGACNLLLLGAGSLALFWRRSEVEWRRLGPIIAFTGYLLLTIASSPEPQLSVRNWIAYAVPLYLALLISADRDPARLVTKGIVALAVCAGTSGLMGLWQVATWNLTYQFNGMPRIPGGHGYPNAFAMFLVLCIMASLLMTSRSRVAGRTALSMATLGPLFALLLFTFSRTGWIVLLACLITCWLMLGKKLASSLLLWSLFLGLLSSYLVPIVMNRFQPDSSYYQRFVLARIGWDLFKDAPLMGHGVGSFQVMSREFLGTVVERHGVPLGLVPHNDVIRFMVEGGLVGLALYFGVLARCASIGWHLFRSGDERNRLFGAFLVSATTGTFVFGLGGQGLAYAAPYLLAATGLGAGLMRHQKVV